jgi:hypothetical protein
LTTDHDAIVHRISSMLDSRILDAEARPASENGGTTRIRSTCFSGLGLCSRSRLIQSYSSRQPSCWSKPCNLNHSQSQPF